MEEIDPEKVVVRINGRSEGPGDYKCQKPGCNWKREGITRFVALGHAKTHGDDYRVICAKKLMTPEEKEAREAAAVRTKKAENERKRRDEKVGLPLLSKMNLALTSALTRRGRPSFPSLHRPRPAR
jgi:hypothetical protein